jgi:uncharacterized protein YcaQ
MSDYALHRPRMARWPEGDTASPRRVRTWLEANEPFRAYVPEELHKGPPLRSRDLEDRALVPWRSTGWTHGRNVGQMLESLAARGEIAVTSREGNERLWDLAERVLPAESPPVSVERPTPGRPCGPQNALLSRPPVSELQHKRPSSLLSRHSGTNLYGG